MRVPSLCTLLASGVLLAACGGGSAVEPMIPPAQPPLIDTPRALVQFIAMQPNSNAAEPVDVSGLVPPTSETEEPVPLT